MGSRTVGYRRLNDEGFRQTEAVGKMNVIYLDDGGHFAFLFKFEI